MKVTTQQLRKLMQVADAARARVSSYTDIRRAALEVKARAVVVKTPVTRRHCEVLNLNFVSVSDL